MTAPAVFRLTDWTATANGFWEAAAPPPRTGDPSPYQATVHLRHDADTRQPSWAWALYLPASDEALDLLANGATPTLREARHQANAAAQQHRYQHDNGALR